MSRSMKDNARLGALLLISHPEEASEEVRVSLDARYELIFY
jgi:hypothetical protein